VLGFVRYNSCHQKCNGVRSFFGGDIHTYCHPHNILKTRKGDLLMSLKGSVREDYCNGVILFGDPHTFCVWAYAPRFVSPKLYNPSRLVQLREFIFNGYSYTMSPTQYSPNEQHYFSTSLRAKYISAGRMA